MLFTSYYMGFTSLCTISINFQKLLKFKMAGRKKNYTLAGAVDFILDSDDKYMDDITSEEESEEEMEPCFRVE